jgi:hypothetical protein
MTIGVRCTAKPGCDGIAPAPAQCCQACARERQAASRTRHPILALIRAWTRQADREAGA